MDEGASTAFSDHLDQTAALRKQLRDARQTRLDPQAQRTIRCVAHAQPQNGRPSRGLHRTHRKVFVLGYDNRAALQRPGPNRRIVRIAQPYVLDVLGLVTCLPQPARERRGQLGIDQKFYLANESTG